MSKDSIPFTPGGKIWTIYSWKNWKECGIRKYRVTSKTSTGYRDENGGYVHVSPSQFSRSFESAKKRILGSIEKDIKRKQEELQGLMDLKSQIENLVDTED